MCRAKSSQTSDERASVLSQLSRARIPHFRSRVLGAGSILGGGILRLPVQVDVNRQRVIDFPLLGAQILPDNSGTRKKVKDVQVGSSILPPS